MHSLRNILQLLGAGALYAVALKYFVLPSKVILTGSEGIAASISYYSDNTDLFILLYLIFQVAILAFGYLKVGKAFTLRTLVVVGTVVSLLAILPDIWADSSPNNERIILVLFGGIIAGLAKAAAFRSMGSTGDEDVVAAFFAMKYLKPVGSIAIAAAAVSTLFGLALEYLKNGHLDAVINTLMYTAVYIFASAETLNNFFHKFKVKMLNVVTTQPARVGAAIIETYSHRTYTIQSGVGGQSGRAYEVVRALLTFEELELTIKAVEEADPQCFFYHHEIEGTSTRYYITPIGHQTLKPARLKNLRP